MAINKKIIDECKENEVMLEQVLDEFKPLVMMIARRYFLLGAEQDDLIQEGMIGLYKAIQTYDDSKKASFKTFANLCISSQIKTAIKLANTSKHKMLNEVMIEDNEEKMYLVLSNKPNPEDIVINKENYDLVKKEITSNLSLREKQILKQFLLGKSYTEIASTLCLTKKSVDNALNRIRKKLEHLL